MAQGKIQIKFEPKGDKALISAIKSLDKATRQLKSQTLKYKIETDKAFNAQKKFSKITLFGTKNLRNMGKSVDSLTPKFSVLRSKLLLVGFAATLFSKTLGRLVKSQMEQEKAEKKLETALGRTSKELLHHASALQEVTRFGDEAIIGAQSLIAAFTKDEEQIKLATQATLDLAEAKGMDLNAAADLVGKSFGSSTNALSRYGIEVHGVVGSSERLESLTENIAILFGGQATAAAQTFSGRVDQMSNSLGDMAEAIGKSIVPVLDPFIDDINRAALNMKDLFLTFSEFDSETIIRNYERLGISTANLIPLKVIAATERYGHNIDNINEKLGESLQRNRSLIPDIRKLAETVGIQTDHWFDWTAVQDVVQNQSLMTAKVGRDQLAPMLKESEKAFEMLATSMLSNAQATNPQRKAQQEQAFALLEVITMLKQAIKAYDDFDKAVIEASQTTVENTEVTTTFFQRFKDGFKGQEDEIMGVVDNIKEWSSAVMNIANQYQALQQTQLNASKQTELNAANDIKWEKKRQREIDKINDKYAKEQEKLNKKSKQAKRTQTVINTATGIMEAYASKELGPFAKHAMAIMVGLLGATQLKTIDAQKYQYGGLVGGNRHSQGGTMIEAERGEFVISRRGVEAAGIEALNRINAGMGGGTVNITFAGNIMSKDFIEDEAIPQIREAIRRGADIGVN